MEPTTQSSAAAAGLGIGFMAAFGIIFIISLICWIKVLVALFKKEGAGLGILGLLCSIYLFIWGWLKSKELGLKKTMIWWTLCIVAAVGLGIVTSVAAVGMAANNPEFQREFKKAMEEAQKKQQEQQVQPAPDAVPAPAPNN